MPAYTPPEQILISPVTSYYKGKAIRQQLAAAEQDAELKGLQIDLAKQEIKDAPSKREAAKRAALLQAENISSQIDKRVRDGEIAELELSAKALTPLLQDYSGTKDEDEALAGFNENIGTAIQSLSPAEQAKVIEAMGPDKQFSHEEVHKIGLGVRMFADQQADTPSDYTLGQGRYSGKTNKLIAGVGPTEGGKPTERDKKIEQYQDILRLPLDMSIKLADGLYDVKPNPVTGTVQIIDETGAVVREVDVEREDVPRPKPESGKTLWDLSTYATGPINTVAAALAIPLAWMGATPAEKIIGARQTFKTTNQDFIRALVNNKRYPIGEVNRIIEEINLVPTFLDDPKLMRIRMLSLHDSLSLRAAQAEADANNPTNPADFRGGAKKAAADINNYLAILGKPTAPQYALDALEEDPSGIDEFEAYYGYRPEGY